MSKFFLLSAVTLTIFSGISHAQQVAGPTQIGYVLDADTRRPIGRAHVNIVGDLALSEEVTDDKGFFLIRFLPTIKRDQLVRVRIQRRGYVPFDEHLKISDGTQQFLLSRNPLSSTQDHNGRAPLKTVQNSFGPEFSEAAARYTVSLGGIKGMTREYEPSDFSGGRILHVAVVNDSSVDAFVEGNRFFANVSIADPNGAPIVRLLHNTLKVSPLGWDWNYNDAALEVVDENKVPILQVIFRTHFDIDIFGAFPVGMGFYELFQENSGLRSPQPICKYQRRKIFKYPSWRHRTEYDDSKYEPIPESTLLQRAAINIKFGTALDFEPNKSGKVQVAFSNDGKTTALNVGAAIRLGRVNPPDSLSDEDFLAVDVTPPKPDLVLEPGGKAHAEVTTATPISDERLENLKSGREVIYVWGIVRYDDVFKMCHRTHFCYSLSKDFALIPCEGHRSQD